MAHVEEADDSAVDSGEVAKPKSKSSSVGGRSTSKNQSAAAKRGSDSEDASEKGDEEDEEEYEIEAIIDSKRGKFKPGEHGYLVKWKGYGPEHNSWVSEGDAVNAKELIDEFFRKKSTKGGTPGKPRGRPSKAASEKDSRPSPAISASASAAKRGRAKNQGKASVSDDQASEDEDVPKSKKKARVGSSANGSGSGKRGSLAALDKSDEDEDVVMDDANGVDMESADARPYTTMKELRLSSIKNWEDHVKRVNTVERGKEGLMVFFETTDNHYVREPSSICARRFPQKLIQFYEEHLRWKMNEDDTNS
ncbi:hypothetical protein M0805_001167 [Coniferiporia weirii]|nr:hypothetical protein M0805_001167 [Coniferiporia weirii]